MIKFEDPVTKPLLCFGIPHFLLKTLFFMVALMFLLTGQACAYSWETQPVDIGEFQYYSSMVLDHHNNPWISYTDNINGDLKFAKWTGSEWITEVVDSTGDVGYLPSIAVDKNNRPGISYYDYTNKDLKFAKWTGLKWITVIVDSTGDVGSASSLIFDHYDNPWISYTDDTNKDLKFAKWTNTEWITEVVDSTGDVGYLPSIAVDKNNRPCISYYDFTNQNLKFAKWTGLGWNTLVIDNIPDYIASPLSLKVDENGKPCISYASLNGLIYARLEGSDWIKWTIGVASIYGTSLAFDSNNYPCIAYTGESFALKFANWTGSEWNTQFVRRTPERHINYYPSLSIGTNKRIYISHTQAFTNNLMITSSVASPPVITGIIPSFGFNSGPVEISIMGKYLQSYNRVYLSRESGDQAPANNIEAFSSSMINCTFNLTGSRAGKRDVIFWNDDGQMAVLKEGFTLLTPAPILTSLSPNSGNNTQNLSVLVSGTNFQNNAQITLCKSGSSNISASSVSVISSSQITALLPLYRETPGTWSVVVTNPDGQTGMLSGGFTILDTYVPPPVLTSVYPSSGENSASLPIVITGSSFKHNAVINLTRPGYDNITAISVSVLSDGQIIGTLPLTDAAAGVWNVVVTNPDGQTAMLPEGFTITDSHSSAPTISSLSPKSGDNSANLSVKITGLRFQAHAGVVMSRTGYPNISAIGVSTLSDTMITGIFPIKGAPAGVWNVVVTNPDGQAGVLKNGFTITAPSLLKISSIAPKSGYNSGTVSVAITGAGFKKGVTVHLKKGAVAISATVRKVTGTRISCSLPLSGIPAGVYTVLVKNKNGTSASKKNGFTVKNAGAKPVFSSISPKTSTNRANCVVSISGKNFRNGCLVSMEKGSLLRRAGIRSVASGKLRCILPTKGAPAGKWSIKITNVDGTTVTKPGVFTVKTAGDPQSPDSGLVMRDNPKGQGFPVPVFSSPVLHKESANSRGNNPPLQFTIH